MASLFSTGLGQSLMEGSLDQPASLLRADLDEQAYVAVGDLIACHLVPSVVGKSNFRNVAPELRELAAGTVQVKLSDDVRVKDQLVVGSRLFEIVAPVTPDSREWIHRFVVREIQLPERVLYLVLKPDGYDGASADEAEIELIKVLPFAFIVDKPVEVVEEGERDKGVVAQLKQVNASEIARSYFSDSNLTRLLYCLVVPSNVVPTAEQASNRTFPRYRFNGSPTLKEHLWGSEFVYSVGLVEER